MDSRLRRTISAILAQPFARPILCLVAHAAAWWTWRYTSSITPDYLLRWAIAYVGTAVVITAVLNRLMTGWLATQMVLVSVWAAASLKERFLQQPLLAHDVVFFLRNTRGNVELLQAYPDYSTAAVVVVVVLVATVVWCARRESRAVAPTRVARWLRVLVPILCCFVVTRSWAMTFGRNARERGQTILRAEVDTFMHEVWFMEQLRYNALPRFLESFWEFEVVEQHDVEQARRFQALAATAAARPLPADARRPDILVVLRESHVDLAQLWEPPAAPAVPAGSERSEWNGELRVHTFGGGTWLTEFSFLAGFSWGDFGNAGSYAPFTLAPRMRECLPVQLRRLGYRTVAFYPVAGTFLNSRVAYQQYGFETFYSSEDLGIGKRWQEMTDREVYAAAMERLRESSDPRPVFAFILTMRNHGPHTRRLPLAGRGLPADWPAKIAHPVADYLDRHAETERDFAWLREQWLSGPTPRLLVSFGDHWPSLEGAVVWLASRLPVAAQPRQRLFRAPLQFVANYRLPAPRHGRDLDVAFLGASVLEVAELDPGPFFSSNRWLRDRCESRYIDAADQPLIRGYLTWAHLGQGAWR